MPRLKSFLLFCLVVGIIISRGLVSDKKDLPVIAIANYGPHSSLFESIRGIRDGLAKKGLIDGKNVSFEIVDVNFDTSLIMQMMSKIKAAKPKVIVAISTPVTQAAKNMVQDIPVIFMDITDPVDAGILLQPNQPNGNITGASDKQDLDLVVKFAKSLAPTVKRIGMLYSTGEANDMSLLKNMTIAAQANNVSLVALPVVSVRDVDVRMHQFKDKVDLIYVGSSGIVQPSLPTIVSIAEKMNIPVLNMNAEEVIDGNVLASYGVSFYKVGLSAAELVYQIFDNVAVSNIRPLYPSSNDHEAFVSKKRLEEIDFKIPDSALKSITLVD